MNRILLLLTVLFTVTISFSQEKVVVSYNNTPLNEVLSNIESQTTILFSYAKEIVENKSISISKREISINKILQELASQTGLIFEKISKNQVIVSRPRIICGFIKDATTKESIPNVTIIIDSKKYTTSNDNGYFKFEKPANNTEEISLNILGYQEKKMTLSVKENCKEIFLSASASELDEVVILGYITTGIDRNKDGSISVDSKRLGILPGLVSPDIAQSIQLIPGISTLDESATGIQIRGGSPDQNLILYDNIKLYNTGYFYGMFSLFNPFATQKATVFRSGTSANYGDRISGIIDISSGNTIPKKNEGGFEIDGLSINGYLKTPLSEKIGLYFFARRSYSDVMQTPTYHSYADKIFTNFGVAKDKNGNILDLETDDDFSRKTSNNNFTFSDYSTKLIIKPNEKNSIAVSALYTRNSLDFDFNSIEEKSVDDLVTINKGFSVNWKHISNKKQQEEITAYYSEYNSFYKNDELEDETGNGNLDITKISIRENNIVDFGLNFSLHKQLNERQKLKLGYQLSNTNLLVDIRKIKPFETIENESKLQDINNFKNALFGEYIYSFANKGFINAGVRFVNYSSLNRFLVEPRINFEYPITNFLRFKTAIERRNQPISQLVEFDNIELRLENNLWRLSDNKQFPLLSSDQISGGLLYRYKKLSVDIDAYYKELKGLTTFTSGFSNPLENLEQGNSTIKGLDLLLKYKWNNYKIWAGYTFNDITFQFPNLPNTPSSFSGNNDIKHQFRISNTLQLNKWQFSLGWQIRNGKPITPVNSYEIKIDADGEKAGVVNFGSINSSRLPNFHRLDASVLYDFKIKTGNKKLNAQFGISVLNLYNRVRPLNLIYKAERKPLDDGGIAVPGTTGSSPEELELILEQVIQRSSLGLTPNAVFRIHF